MSTDMPLVSILIPVYNRSNMVIEAIESVLNQDYNNIEIIVGDNCSTDGTFDVIRNSYYDFKSIVLFQNEKNLGPVGNWEACLSRAHGKYVKFLWSDDLLRKDFLTRAVDMLEKHPEASFAFSSVKIFDENDDIYSIMMDNSNTDSEYTQYNETGVFSGKQFIVDSCLNKSVPVSPGCALFRKEKLLIVSDIPNRKGYEHRKTGAGIDLLMFYEALSNGEKVAYISEICSYFRNHKQSITVRDSSIGVGYGNAKKYYIKKHFRTLGVKTVIIIFAGYIKNKLSILIHNE